jgi:hypothetical protein
MKALVVYESMWGNTAMVARAIAHGLGDAPVASVDQLSSADTHDLDLLVIGGPTHAFSMSRPNTRADAMERGAPATGTRRGIREWLLSLPDHVDTPVATFDTRVAKVKHLPGSAAKKAASELRRRHKATVVAARSFYVDDMGGPLLPGELEQADAWGAELAGRAR